MNIRAIFAIPIKRKKYRAHLEMMQVITSVGICETRVGGPIDQATFKYRKTMSKNSKATIINFHAERKIFVVF